MKPNFALTLSFEGISLLHRAFPGWHLVGEVALDCADLTAELAALRQTALALDPTGMCCKLVLPNDQIKYLQIAAPEADSDMTDTLRAALEGTTPYAVDNLVYDWSLSDGSLCIAAVARETLVEAEAFAAEHHFNPVCFVAMPQGDPFAGEPFFGATQYLIESGETEDALERDSTPIRIIGASKTPVAPEAGAEPESDSASEEVAAPSSETDSVPEPEEKPTPEPSDEPEPEEALTPEPDLATPATAEIHAEPIKEEEPEPEEPLVLQPNSQPETERKESDPAHADDTAPTGEPAPQAAFSTIRARRDDRAAGSPRLDGVVRDSIAPRIRLGALPEDDTPPQAVEVTGISDAALPEDEALDSPAIRPVVEDALPHPGAASEPEDRPAFFTRRSKRRAKEALAPDSVPEPTDEAQRMTVFGARKKVAVGGKPRYLGLIMTVVLLLFLIGVAAWASIFLDEGLARFFRSESPPALADLPDAPATDEELAEAAEDGVVELASLQPDEPVSVLDDPATEILSRVSPADLSPDEAKARYAATGIWQLAPEPPAETGPTEMREFYQTSLDPNPGFQDAVALPKPRTTLTDDTLNTPPSPMPANTRFSVDARGFVVPTEKGALSPDGVIVFAGKPPLLPPATIRRGGVPVEDPAVEEAPAPQLAALRPRARPSDIAEKIERNELNGRTRSELAAIRPKLRPESAQEAAKAKADADAAALAAAEAAKTPDTGVDSAAVEAAGAAAAATPDPFAGATRQAVKVSLKPNIRPRNFDRIVKRTKKKQQSKQQEQAAVAVSASQRVAPKIPSAASVSKQATQKNALKIKRVNLIGVYGTQSNRRALVRMSNGRYKKVKVGDRLDGGKVRAIGDSELSYSKGGRSVVLKMPRG